MTVFDRDYRVKDESEVMSPARAWGVLALVCIFVWAIVGYTFWGWFIEGK